MTVAQFAQKAEISKSLAYRIIHEGRVPHRRIGGLGRRGKIILTEEDCRKFLESVRAASE